MTTDAVPNFRPATAPRAPVFRVDLQWLGPPMDDETSWIAQGLLNLFAPNDGLKATNGDFIATLTAKPDRVRQLLQCLGVLRELRIRFEVWGDGETLDDVDERLHGSQTWSYYPDPERAVRAQAAAAEKAKPSGRPRGTRLSSG